MCTVFIYFRSNSENLHAWKRRWPYAKKNALGAPWYSDMAYSDFDIYHKIKIYQLEAYAHSSVIIPNQS